MYGPRARGSTTAKPNWRRDVVVRKTPPCLVKSRPCTRAWAADIGGLDAGCGKRGGGSVPVKEAGDEVRSGWGGGLETSLAIADDAYAAEQNSA